MGYDMIAADSLRSFQSGLGTPDDKTTGSHFYLNILQPDQLEAMYGSDWMARKAVDIPAFDSVRAWRNWQAEADHITAIEKEEKRLGLKSKLLDAMILGRLYGGAALVMGVRDDDPLSPLRPETVKQGDLRYVHVMDKSELTSSEMRRDPEDEWYGEPRTYNLNTDVGAAYQIHPSRVIPLTGARRANRQRRKVDPWGDSVLQAIVDAVKNAALASQSIAQLLSEAKVDVVKIPDLAEHLSTAESTQRLTTRWHTAMTIKSTINALLLAGGEEYEQKQVSFAQLPEVLQQYMLVVSGAADIPATRFLGQSPAGMSATGESDLKNYYDRIGAEQELTLTPKLNRLDEVMIRSALNDRPDELHYNWAPLFQKDAKELAEIEKTRSEAAAKNASSGLIPTAPMGKALINAMIESGQWPGLEDAMEEYEAETPEFDPNAGDPNNPDPDAPVDPDPEDDPTQAADAAPRTLYVYRKVLNAGEIVKWAKEQGFENPLEADDMHVTIMHSKSPVDWMKASDTFLQERDGKLVVPPGGPRIVEPLGDKGAVVLHFASSELSWRHEDIKRKTGAEWSFPSFEPHISIVYEGAGDMDLSKVKPFTGRIELGPEIFEEFVDSWRPNTKDALPRDARGRFVKRS
ncbi:phage portal protein [Henriciella sp.]|uniref:phage portal protein n=1 Tax=Henriciella sp. TaxID=1968823 RepID=UPI002611101C|nr:anti-CBASS Acb1 family protein [Henriciella sp.]